MTLDLWAQLAAGPEPRVLADFYLGRPGDDRQRRPRRRPSSDARRAARELPGDVQRGWPRSPRKLAGLAGPVEVNGKKGEIDLAPANQLFGDASIHFQQAFLTVLAKMYGAGMRTVDFVKAAEQARTLVNQWTAQQTHGRDPRDPAAGQRRPVTRLVLVNALYFKAPWAARSRRRATSPGAFHRADGSGHGPADADDGRGRGLPRWDPLHGRPPPYRDGTLAMTLALPTGREAAALAELLGPHGLTADGEPAVAVSMPRWTYRVPTDLKDALVALGMNDAFDARSADFSRMTAEERLFISFVVHQTFVAVDEDGTEAAAATAVGMADSAAIQSHTLVLDRPFLFVIHDTAHGTPLFVGRVADPSRG